MNINSNNFISVIICTYNRCESLKDALDSLLLHDLNMSFDYEIVVVDNNSTDATRQVVESYMAAFGGKLRYIFEPNQGLSYARNRGIKESKGGVMAFTDDDVIVDKKWLLNIAWCFENYDCDAIGGRVLPLFNKNTPKWIRDNIDILFGPFPFYDYGDNVREYNTPTMLPFIGANMIFKKHCFNRIGLFSEDLGSGSGRAGEDTEYFRRLEKNSLKLYYCGQTLVWHKIENSRTNLKYIAQWCIQSGRYSVTIKKGATGKRIVSYFGIPRYLFRSITEHGFLLIIYFLNRRKLLENMTKAFRELGMIKEYRKLYLCLK